MLYLGLDSEVDEATNPTVESEDSPIFKRMPYLTSGVLLLFQSKFLSASFS